MALKVIFVILLIMMAVLPIIRFEWPQIAEVGYIILIISGISIDLIDFVIRMVASLQRKPVPSAGMFLGLLLMGIGLHGLTVLSDFTVFGWHRWKSFFILFILAFVLHILIHLIAPLLFTIACNLIYGRKLFDMTTLPNKNVDKENL